MKDISMKEAGFVKLLVIMLFIYLMTFGVMLSSDNLLSEFFIATALIYTIIIAFFINMASGWKRMLFYGFVILTVVSNSFFYFMPQKISAGSINRILDEIENKNKDAARLAVFRIGLFNLPYEAGLRSRFKIYFDEHVYESKENTREYLALIDKEFKSAKKVYLISPGFLFGESKEVNINSMIPVSMDDAAWLENLKFLLEQIKQKYSITVAKDYKYNFGTLGQLGKLALVELKE